MSDDATAFSMLDPRIMDPDGEIVDRSGLSAEDVDEVVAVLEAMNEWRDTERSMSEASRRYMRLGDTDMRALRFLIAQERNGQASTPGSIAAHLGVTAAATTKLLDRLAAGGHVTRAPHPDDRRSTSIHVTAETRQSARASVGRSHARRFDAIAQLSSADRAAVLRFFRGLIDTAEWVQHDEE
ncbi:MarR family winged helix-turn-helix transcriptional regulator [Microbacterium sp. GXF6406]